jgi:hypothetical protein
VGDSRGRFETPATTGETHFQNTARTAKGEKKVAAERDKSQNRQSSGAKTAKYPDF